MESLSQTLPSLDRHTRTRSRVRYLLYFANQQKRVHPFCRAHSKNPRPTSTSVNGPNFSGERGRPSRGQPVHRLETQLCRNGCSAVVAQNGGWVILQRPRPNATSNRHRNGWKIREKLGFVSSSSPTNFPKMLANVQLCACRQPLQLCPSISIRPSVLQAKGSWFF